MRKVLPVFLLSLCPGLFGENISPFVMPSARASALGGNHVAFSDDFYALFTNPASFVDVESEFSIAELTLSTYGPVFEIIDILIEHSDSWDDLNLTPVIGANGFAAGLDFGGPLAVGWVGRGLGLGMFTRMKADAIISGFQLRPAVSAELLLLGGYSFRVLEKSSNVFDAGFLGKGFFRVGLDFSSSVFQAEKMFDDVWGRDFTTILGLGFDLGVKYTFANTFSAALVCFDAYTPAMVTTYASMESFKNKDDPKKEGHYATVKPGLDLGLKYRIRSTLLDKYITNINLLADYRDFLDLGSLIPRHPLLNIGLGLEVVVLEKLSLRFGLTDALPAAGFGLDLSFMQFDCSIHGKELGLDPGIHSIYAVDFALLFRY
jgi:hypothetical protein